MNGVFGPICLSFHRTDRNLASLLSSNIAAVISIFLDYRIEEIHKKDESEIYHNIKVDIAD
ncbi:MAG TPA: hypothetical protein VKA95_05060 [Nitrososphaeraceae archaeon]|nr:hypothetical protein [Nitrososphaeraceae archaeon]